MIHYRQNLPASYCRSAAWRCSTYVGLLQGDPGIGAFTLIDGQCRAVMAFQLHMAAKYINLRGKSVGLR